MVSVVMPAFNEAGIIEASVREWYQEVVSRIPKSELIVVDDCSTDETGAILHRLQSSLPALRVLRPETNGGHGKALRYGFDHAVCEWIFQTDSDRQHIPAEFWKAWEMRATDFVFGIRKRRADGAFRVSITGIMRCLNLVLWGIWLWDANCPYKLMRTSALRHVLRDVPRESFIPMVMVSILARKLNFRVAEVPVTHLPRTGGTQSLKGLLKWMKVSSRCALQLAALGFSLNRESGWARHPQTSYSRSETTLR